ncbi:MAG: hypothetical protein WCE23_00450 [Candidatus Binatus sp.]|uniref:hypothetical protein n=1 Tax=Candidatus Binatus sp. TaxID=2811406 RepID=UPI003C7328AA
MSNRRDELVESFKRGDLLETVYASFRSDRTDQDDLALELAALHNQGLIDVVAAFAGLKNTSTTGADFFLTRDVFRKALPHINAPVAPVMRCVLQLCREAGQDIAAEWVIDGFAGFCAEESSRPRDALNEIEANPEMFAGLLVPSLFAGSRIDNTHYLAEAIRLCEDKNIELRKRAVFSVGRLSWPQGVLVPDSAFVALERSAATESDDHILANVVWASFGLLQRDKSREDRAVALIANALAKGGEHTLHAASEVFGLYTSELSAPQIGVLLPHLRKVKPTNKRTLDNIDCGISYLLRKDESEQALSFLQDLLLADPGKLTLKAFDSAAEAIRSNRALLGKVMTRWFLRGDPVLCDGIQIMTAAHLGDNLELQIDPAELRPADLEHVIFAARKAVGYLFFRPVSAASVLISLMRYAGDDGTLNELVSLLFDPLLLNFTGSVHTYVVQRSKTESGKVKEMIDRALRAIDDYLQTLRSVGSLPALQPSEAQREAHHRNFSRQMTESFRAAEAQSPFLSMISKSILLYGRKSIDYVYDGDGQSHRMEMDLKSHGTEIEYPRMALIDPCGLDYMLSVFRIVRLSA